MDAVLKEQGSAEGITRKSSVIEKIRVCIISDVIHVYIKFDFVILLRISKNF